MRFKKKNEEKGDDIRQLNLQLIETDYKDKGSNEKADNHGAFSIS